MTHPNDFQRYPFYTEKDPRTIGGRKHFLVGVFNVHETAIEWSLKLRNRSTIVVYARTLRLTNKHHQKHGEMFRWGVWIHLPAGWDLSLGEFPSQIHPHNR
jgi:hypothetical protein